MYDKAQWLPDMIVIKQASGTHNSVGILALIFMPAVFLWYSSRTTNV